MRRGRCALVALAVAVTATPAQATQWALSVRCAYFEDFHWFGATAATDHLWWTSWIAARRAIAAKPALARRLAPTRSKPLAAEVWRELGLRPGAGPSRQRIFTLELGVARSRRGLARLRARWTGRRVGAKHIYERTDKAIWLYAGDAIYPESEPVYVERSLVAGRSRWSLRYGAYADVADAGRDAVAMRRAWGARVRTVSVPLDIHLPWRIWCQQPFEKNT